MRQLAFTILFLLFCIQRPISAQDVSPAPWPPDPSSIFEAGIEVIEQQSVITPVVTSPQFVSDDDKRSITIENADEDKTKIYAYPKEFKSIISHTGLDDPRLWLEVEETLGETWVWTLERQTKIFTRYTAHCHQQSPLFIDDVAAGTWVLYENPSDNHTYLCETATGKLSSALPDDMWWSIGDIYVDMPHQPSALAHDQWLILYSSEKNDPNLKRTFVYSYNITSDQLTQLGDFEVDGFYQLDRWVGTQILIYTGQMPEWSTRKIYIADVTKAQSLEYAVGRYRYRPDYYDDPPRFDFVTGIEGDSYPHQCRWIVYSIETRKLVTHDLGTMCLPEIGSLSEDAYYREIIENQPGRPTTAKLVRFNALTGTRKELYSGTIESVEWVSADEQTAIMTLSTNGFISRVPYLGSDDWSPNPDNLRLSYVDLVHKKVLFDIPAYWEFDGSGYWLASFIKKVDQNTFLAVGYTDYQEGFASLFTFDSKKYVEKRLVNHIVKALGKYLLVWTDGLQNSTRLSLYEIATGQSIPIIQNVDPHQYRIHLDETEEAITLDNFIITITNVPTTTADYHSARYKVKIFGIAG